MWVGLFPLLWHVLDERARFSVGNALQQLLSQEYHMEQATQRPNNVAALLAGISRCVPQPTPGLEPKLLVHLARTHNVWHTAISMLRQQAMLRQQRASPNEKPVDGSLDPIQDAVSSLYLQLGEQDTWFGLWRLRTKLGISAKALAYEQQGSWEEAQVHYEEAIQKALNFRDAEFKLWEQHWVTCAEQLGQHKMASRQRTRMPFCIRRGSCSPGSE